MSNEKSRKRTADERQRIMRDRKARNQSTAAPKVIATHKVEPDETLSHIALKYYKRATPPFWKLILEHNTELLKGNERNVRAGMELEIPELPDNLKE